MGNPERGNGKGKSRTVPSLRDLLDLDENTPPPNGKTYGHIGATLGNMGLLSYLNNSSSNDLPSHLGREGVNMNMSSSRYDAKECKLRRLNDATSDDLPSHLGGEGGSEAQGNTEKECKLRRLNYATSDDLPSHLGGEGGSEAQANTEKECELSHLNEAKSVSNDLPSHLGGEGDASRVCTENRMRRLIRLDMPSIDIAQCAYNVADATAESMTDDSTPPRLYSTPSVDDESSAAEEEFSDKIPQLVWDFGLNGEFLMSNCVAESWNTKNICDYLKPIFPLDSPWLPFYLANREMSEACVAGFKLKLYEISDELRRLDPVFLLRPEDRNMFYVNVFYLKRLYSSRRRNTDLASLVCSWNDFVNAIAKDHVRFFTSFLVSRFKFESSIFSFGQKISTGLRMRIHRISIMDTLPCLVPSEMNCELCNPNVKKFVDPTFECRFKTLKPHIDKLLDIIKKRDKEHERIQLLKEKYMSKQHAKNVKRLRATFESSTPRLTQEPVQKYTQEPNQPTYQQAEQATYQQLVKQPVHQSTYQQAVQQPVRQSVQHSTDHPSIQESTACAQSQSNLPVIQGYLTFEDVARMIFVNSQLWSDKYCS